MAVAVLSAVAAAAAAAKPKVPVGIDPGGVAIAVIGDGIDYTRPEIASRLARDGEGEIIGFDLVDRDRLPYSPQPPEGTCGAGSPPPSGCVQPHPAVAALQAASLTQQASKPPSLVRIAVFRVAGDVRQVAEAIAMSARSPAQIVLFQETPPVDLLREAVQRFPSLSFVVPPPAADARGYVEAVKDLKAVHVGCAAAEGPVPCTGTAAELAGRAAAIGAFFKAPGAIVE